MMSFITKKHIARRTFLHGAGVTLALPLLGGAYLRLVPAAAVRVAARRARRRVRAWTYAHPYDFDEGEPYTFVNGGELLLEFLLLAVRLHVEKGRLHAQMRRMRHLAAISSMKPNSISPSAWNSMK